MEERQLQSPENLPLLRWACGETFTVQVAGADRERVKPDVNGSAPQVLRDLVDKLRSDCSLSLLLKIPDHTGMCLKAACDVRWSPQGEVKGRRASIRPKRMWLLGLLVSFPYGRVSFHDTSTIGGVSSMQRTSRARPPCLNGERGAVALSVSFWSA